MRDSKPKPNDPLSGMTPKQIFKDCVWISDETTTTKLFLLCIARFFDQDAKNSSMSYAQVAADCSLSRRACMQAAHAARDRWLKIGVQKGWATGSGRQNLYEGIAPPQLLAELRRRKGVHQDHPLERGAPRSPEGCTTCTPRGAPRSPEGCTTCTLTLDNSDYTQKTQREETTVTASVEVEAHEDKTSDDRGWHHALDCLGRLVEADHAKTLSPYLRQDGRGLKDFLAKHGGEQALDIMVAVLWRNTIDGKPVGSVKSWRYFEKIIVEEVNKQKLEKEGVRPGDLMASHRHFIKEPVN